MDSQPTAMDAASAWTLTTAGTGLARLKSLARESSPQAPQEVSRQFEALFLQMMLQSMRDAALADGILDNDDGKFYQQLFDQQVARSLTEHGGIGLGEAILRQLSLLADMHPSGDAPEKPAPPAIPAAVDGGPAGAASPSEYYRAKSIASYLRHDY